MFSKSSQLFAFRNSQMPRTFQGKKICEWGPYTYTCGMIYESVFLSHGGYPQIIQVITFGIPHFKKPLYIHKDQCFFSTCFKKLRGHRTKMVHPSSGCLHHCGDARVLSWHRLGGLVRLSHWDPKKPWCCWALY